MGRTLRSSATGALKGAAVVGGAHVAMNKGIGRKVTVRSTAVDATGGAIIGAGIGAYNAHVVKKTLGRSGTSSIQKHARHW